MLFAGLETLVAADAAAVAAVGRSWYGIGPVRDLRAG